MNWPPLIIEEIDSPEVIARSQLQHERFRRNSEWLERHWGDLLPQAFGKHLAVAGQEAFLGDTVEEAVALAKAVHPDDDGMFVEYVLPPGGPRLYGDHGVIHLGSGWDHPASPRSSCEEGQRSI
jgi:hypothetical protein